jgi:quercetin dioxygenase-like cupin family protein
MATNPLGGDLKIHLRGEQTGGSLSVLEVGNRPGQGPPLHIHTQEDETAYVLAGEVRWKLGDESFSNGPGSFVFIPKGVPHTWQVIGEEEGRFLVTFTPAGMEGFFDRLADLAEFDPEAFRAAAAEHAMEVVGQPLAESDPL